MEDLKQGIRSYVWDFASIGRLARFHSLLLWTRWKIIWMQSISIKLKLDETLCRRLPIDREYRTLNMFSKLMYWVQCSLYIVLSTCIEYIVHCSEYILFIVHCTLHTPEYSEAISCTQSCRCKKVHVGEHLIILKPQQIKITTKLEYLLSTKCAGQYYVVCAPQSELFVSWREYFFESLESLLLLSKSSLTFLSPSRWSATDERT